jgi:hypothetical protein
MMKQAKNSTARKTVNGESNWTVRRMSDNPERKKAMKRIIMQNKRRASIMGLNSGGEIENWHARAALTAAIAATPMSNATATRPSIKPSE